MEYKLANNNLNERLEQFSFYFFSLSLLYFYSLFKAHILLVRTCVMRVQCAHGVYGEVDSVTNTLQFFISLHFFCLLFLLLYDDSAAKVLLLVNALFFFFYLMRIEDDFFDCIEWSLVGDADAFEIVGRVLR